jgi:chromosome segregation ATPase
MKPPKKSSKEPPLPSQDESRRTNVLFEKLISEFRTVGESVSAVRERVDRIEPKLDKQGEDIEILKAAARSHTNAIRANGEDIRSLKEAVQGNTEAIRDVQIDLKNINQRLEVVEVKVAS